MRKPKPQFQSLIEDCFNHFLQEFKLKASWEEIILRVVTVEEVSQYRKPGDINMGSCIWFPEYRQAVVEILDPADPAASEWYTAFGEDLEKTVEETVIHELLHILLEGSVEKTKKYSAHYEWALNVLSAQLRENYREIYFGKKSTNNRRSRADKTAKVASKNRS